jgi:hypothetical protein
VNADMLKTVGRLQDAIWESVAHTWKEWLMLSLEGEKFWRTRSLGRPYWFEVGL